MSGQLKYVVDLVYCIDATGSMGGLIEKVKESAVRFHDDLKAKLDEKQKNIDTLRIRVVSFRDYYCDGTRAMSESPFFTLPDESEQFKKFVSGIHADGGGDEPESGLEALALAIKSDWNKTGDKRRQVIVLFTDASAHPLEAHAGSKPSNYPADMPADFNAMTDLWEGQTMSRPARRLIMFAPDAAPWADIATHWEQTLQYASKAGEGLADQDYSTILDAIANSV